MCRVMIRGFILGNGTFFLDLPNKVCQLLLEFEISSMAESEEIEILSKPHTTLAIDILTMTLPTMIVKCQVF